jgi:hypothetical protein
LDRGGLPASSHHHVEVEIGLDSEIEQLLRGVARNREQVESDSFNVEDAIVIEEEAAFAALPIGEQVARGRSDGSPLVSPFDKVGGPRVAKQVADKISLDLPVEPAPEPIDEAWWQANPPPV